MTHKHIIVAILALFALTISVSAATVNPGQSEKALLSDNKTHVVGLAESSNLDPKTEKTPYQAQILIDGKAQYTYKNEDAPFTNATVYTVPLADKTSLLCLNLSGLDDIPDACLILMLKEGKLTVCGDLLKLTNQPHFSVRRQNNYAIKAEKGGFSFRWCVQDRATGWHFARVPYTFENGKLTKPTDTFALAYTGVGTWKNNTGITTKTIAATTKPGGKAKAFTVAAGGQLTLRAVKVTTKAQFLQVKSGKKSGWVKISGSGKAWFKEAVFAG